MRPALDLAYDVGGKVNGAFLFRYLYPVAEGLKAGVGLGVGVPGFDFGNTRFYFRADAEYDLKAAMVAPSSWERTSASWGTLRRPSSN